MIERTVDFDRLRSMQCGECGYGWSVTAEWLDRFNRSREGCPHCGANCESENRPDFCAHPDDPVRDDATVPGLHWYHSSSRADWPSSDFDPAAHFTAQFRRMYERQCGPGATERWVARQKSKALHVGTYEAAIENMFRRMRSPGDATEQFFLYRVRLAPDCVIEPGVHKERSSWGDVHLAELCDPGANALRYVNVYEDHSSISLAISPTAIKAVQRIPIPLAVDRADPWVADAAARLREAANRPSPPLPGSLAKYAGRGSSDLRGEARTLEEEVACGLPFAAREVFNGGFDERTVAAEPEAHAAKLIGLAHLSTHPQAVLAALDSQPWRLI